ncbi:MAG: hypothetical protein C5B44_04070 [Acidobacteria bacterium]|nr:MAG: hypothetical protein C5B44_04070 [Acidobacteriota bacterium]
MLSKILSLTVIAAIMMFLLASPPAHLATKAKPEANTSPLTGSGRFRNTPKIKGTFTVSGSGGGNSSTDRWTVDQSASGSFNLTINPISGVNWDGTFQASVHVNDSRGRVVPPILNQTWIGTGTITNNVFLTIDEDRCKYTLYIERGTVPVIATSGPPNVSQSVAYEWGPFGSGLQIQDIPLPVSGRSVTGSRQISNAQTAFGTGDFTISWQFECDVEGEGALPVTHLRQNDPAWRSDTYDHSTNTIWGIGCAMTSLTMAMRFLGSPLDPGLLNSILIALGGYSGTSVNWPVATNKGSGGDFKFHPNRTSSTTYLDEVLCMGFPIIVGVKLSGGVPKHFVIVIGKNGSDYTINDPAFNPVSNPKTKLSQYGAFETRGFVTPASWNGNPNACGGHALTDADDKSALTIFGDNNVEVLVVDPNGRRTGFDSATGNLVEDIPESVYFRDSFEDDQTGTPPNEINHLIEMDHPMAGSYQLVVIGRQAGPYRVTIEPFSRDGSAQNPIVFQGTAPGGSVTFPFQYSPTPGQSSSTTEFSAASYNASEQDGSATITVSRTGDTSGTASVEYATSDGTAHQRTDYTLATGVLTFAPGETSKNFTILLTDNAYVDGNRTLNINLSHPSGVTLGTPSTATLTIADNDTAPPTSNPADNASFFVRQHYYDFLSRLPDQGGLDYWIGQVNSCGSNQICLHRQRTAVSDAFFFEPEFQQTGSYVFRLYRAAYGNNQPFPNPDPGNINESRKIPSYSVFVSDRARVIAGPGLAQSQLDLANALVQRQEFLTRYPANLNTAALFVNAVLATVQTDLGVNLSSERAKLIDLFNQGGRGAVMYRLADDSVTNPINNRSLIDAEYNRAFVTTEYFGFLRRDADIAGLLFWFDKVNSAPLRNTLWQHAMVCAFTTSAEYQTRFSSVVTHTNADCGDL